MFSLTKQERQVILFLITLALAGTGVNFFTKKFASNRVILAYDKEIFKIDLNKADKDSLISIPGIGEKLAKRIIECRQQHGEFKDIEELKNIKGITNYRYERIKDSFVLH